MDKILVFLAVSFISFAGCAQSITPNCQGNYTVFVDGGEVLPSYNTEAYAMAKVVELQALNPNSVVVYLAGDVGAPRTCGVDIPQSFYDAVVAAQNPPPPPPNSPPSITLISGALSFEVPQSYAEPGCSCSDPEDGPLACASTNDFPIPIVAGVYTVNYQCTDSGSLTDSTQRTVTYTDPPPPPPSGFAYRGILDPSAHLGFDIDGQYPIDVPISEGGTRLSLSVNNSGRMTISCVGTAQSPCVVNLTGQVINNNKIVISGSSRYLIVQGGKINAPTGGGPMVRVPEFSVIRDMEVAGPRTGSTFSSAVEMSSNSVWLRGSIHGFGDNSPNAPEQDFHGIKKTHGAHVWVLDAEIYDNSGDSVQFGDATGTDITNCYIGGGVFRDNRENGVDIKTAFNCVVSGVTMHGFSPTSSDPGAAIVIHNGATDVEVYDNVITDTEVGLVTSGQSGHIIDGNSITATGTCIECRNTSGVTIENNTLSCPTPFDLTQSCTGTIQ